MPILATAKKYEIGKIYTSKISDGNNNSIKVTFMVMRISNRDEYVKFVSENHEKWPAERLELFEQSHYYEVSTD